MHELGWLSDENWRAAAAQAPVLYRPAFTPRTRTYFLDALAREARRRFALEELRSRGYTLLTTLDYDDQAAGEKALAEGLAHGEETGAEAGLQGALLSIDPGSARILAWVGGRSYQDSQFDRVELARRQPGSAFKPVIFTAAFAHGVATPVDPARGRAAGAHGRRQGVGAAERRQAVPRLGDGEASARGQHQRRHHPPGRARGLEPRGRDRARPRHRCAAPAGAVARAGIDRGRSAAARHRLFHARERRLAHRAASPARGARRVRASARRLGAGAASSGHLARGGVPGVLPAPGRARSRHCRVGARAGRDRPARGQDRHHQLGARQLVRRLLAPTAPRWCGSGTTTTAARGSRATAPRFRSGRASCWPAGRRAATGRSRRRRACSSSRSIPRPGASRGGAARRPSARRSSARPSPRPTATCTPAVASRGRSASEDEDWRRTTATVVAPRRLQAASRGSSRAGRGFASRGAAGGPPAVVPAPVVG